MAEPQAPENQQTARQAVIQGFKHLADLDYYRLVVEDNPVEGSRRDIFADLHSNLLPLLHQQLSDLSAAVHGLRNEPVSQLGFIRNLQTEVVQTLRQTANATTSLIDYEELSWPVRNDQHFKELKPFRLQLLNDCYLEMLGRGLREWFLYCHLVIEKLQYAPPNQQRTPGSHSGRDEIPVRPPYHLAPVLRAISLSKASELHLLKDLWIPYVKNIGIECDRLLFLIHRTTSREGSTRFGRQVILLAKSMVPIFKLSRLFFDKLLREGMGKRDVPVFTGMCSHQLLTLETAPSCTETLISRLLRVVQAAQMRGPANTCKEAMAALKELWTAFPSYVLLAHFYIVPLFPDIQGWSSEIGIKAWLTDWDTLFNITIHNSFEIARSIS